MTVQLTPRDQKFLKAMWIKPEDEVGSPSEQLAADSQRQSEWNLRRTIFFLEEGMRGVRRRASDWKCVAIVEAVLLVGVIAAFVTWGS